MIASLLGNLAALALSQASLGPVPETSGSSSPIVWLASAPSGTHQRVPVKRRPESYGVKTSSPSVFVADLSTGSVLYAKDPHRVVPIASLTKLMTAMVFLDQHPDMSRRVVMVEGDFDDEGKDYFKPGDELTYDDLLKSMLVGSVNASANAIARTSLGEGRFVEAMQDKAAALKLKSPHFVEPSGVNPQNQANAADIAAIIATANGYPKIREYAQIPELSIQPKNGGAPVRITSTNLLLSTYLNKQPYKIMMAKTGSLPEAGYCMAQITQNKDGDSVIAVELGSDNHFARYQDIKSLTTWAFSTYRWQN